MRNAKCIDCGKPAKRYHCNSCSNIISVCDEHLQIYFPIMTLNDFVCIDCANSGNGGINRWLQTHNKESKESEV